MKASLWFFCFLFTTVSSRWRAVYVWWNNDGPEISWPTKDKIWFLFQGTRESACVVFLFLHLFYLFPLLLVRLTESEIDSCTFLFRSSKIPAWSTWALPPIWSLYNFFFISFHSSFSNFKFNELHKLYFTCRQGWWNFQKKKKFRIECQGGLPIWRMMIHRWKNEIKNTGHFN